MLGAWWTAMRRDWHRKKALRLYRWAEVHAKQSQHYRDKALRHEHQAKHLHLEVTKLRIIHR